MSEGKKEFLDPPAGFPSGAGQADEGGVPDLPEVQVEDPHWKVGDGMTTAKGRPDFIIGQIAVVQKSKATYDIVFFDTKGVERGRLHMVPA